VGVLRVDLVCEARREERHVASDRTGRQREEPGWDSAWPGIIASRNPSRLIDS